MMELRQKYEEFKKTLPSPSEKKDISKIVENFPVPPQKLSNVSSEQLREWEKQSEVVEWVRNRTKSNSTVFLQQKTLNLLTALNVAALVPNGKLLLKTEEAEWQKVSRYAAELNVKNINRLGENDSFIAAEYFITENAATVQMLAAEINQKQRVVLAYFDEAVEGSKELLYKLYARFWIRRVAIFPSFYFGYEVFDHFLWSSEHPKGFF